MSSPESPRIKITKQIALILILLFLIGLGYFVWQITRPEKQASTPTQNQANKTNNTPSNASTSCPSTLTTADQDAITLWKTFQNPTPKFSFNYPETWQIAVQEANRIVLNDQETSINYSLMTGSAAQIGVEAGFTQTASAPVTVACQSATKTNYSSNDDRLIWVKFTKEDTPYLISISYQYLGASISSDIVEAFDLILKTVKF